MLKQENDEKTNLINLDEYYSNFFYKDQKFKKSFKNKILSLREYFSENPKMFFCSELLIGLLCFGFPLFYLFYILRSIKYQNKQDIQYDQKFIQAAIPLIIIISIILITVVTIIALKIRRIFKSRL